MDGSKSHQTPHRFSIHLKHLFSSCALKLLIVALSNHIHIPLMCTI